MQVVEVWPVAPSAPCREAVAGAVTIARDAYLRLAQQPVTLDLGEAPSTPPPTPPPTTLITARLYIALLIIDNPMTEIPPTVDSLVNVVIKLQQDQRPVEVLVLVDAGIAALAHDDFARRRPEDAGLRPWRLLTYSNSLDLQRIVTQELLRAIADSTDMAHTEKGGMYRE